MTLHAGPFPLMSDVELARLPPLEAEIVRTDRCIAAVNAQIQDETRGMLVSFESLQGIAEKLEPLRKERANLEAFRTTLRTEAGRKYAPLSDAGLDGPRRA